MCLEPTELNSKVFQKSCRNWYSYISRTMCTFLECYKILTNNLNSNNINRYRMHCRAVTSETCCTVPTDDSIINKCHHHCHKSIAKTVWTCLALCCMRPRGLGMEIAPAHYYSTCYNQGTWDFLPIMRTVWLSFSFIICHGLGLKISSSFSVVFVFIIYFCFPFSFSLVSVTNENKNTEKSSMASKLQTEQSWQSD